MFLLRCPQGWVDCVGFGLAMENMTKDEIIEHLNLELHPSEGGYFRRTYESSLCVGEEAGSRKLLTSIYYMLTDDSPVGYLHKNKSDIIHYHHLGSSITYVIVSPEGVLSKKIVGSNLAAGEQLQLVVPGGYWKASRLNSGEYSLISEAVVPGFEYADNQIATEDMVAEIFPLLKQKLEPFIKK